MTRNWLVCYPRSGSTWVRLIFANLLHPEKFRGYRETDYIVPDFHAIDRWNLERMQDYSSKLYIVKSHHPIMAEYFEDKCVYMYRDPRDVVISEYSFELWRTGKDFSFDEFFRRFIRAETIFESWKLHVTCWTVNTTNTDLKHLVKYETLYEYPVREVRKMCDFFEYPTTDVEIQTAVDKCAFSNCIKISPQEQVDPRKRGLVGKPGKWREFLSQEQKDEMWKWVGDLMEKLGYEK